MTTASDGQPSRDADRSTDGADRSTDRAEGPMASLLAAVRAGLAGESATVPEDHRERVRSLAEAHRVVPLAAAPLTDDALAARRRDVAAASLRLAEELRDVLDVFEDRGIRAVAYKGPALAADAYGDLAGRQYGDVDVLVPPDDATRAFGALADRGCRTDPALSTAERRGLVGHGSWRNYECGGAVVDLQWRLAPTWYPVGVDVATLQARATTTRLRGRELPVLSPVDRLLALSVHGSKHGWTRLQWVADVAALASGGFDAGRLLERAREAGCRRRVLVAFALAERTLDADVPAVLERAMRDDAAVEWLVADARDRLLASRTELSVPNHRVVPFHLRSLERPADRVRYAGRLAFSPGPADVRAAPDRAGLSTLRYLVRPPRLAVGAARSALARIR